MVAIKKISGAADAADAKRLIREIRIMSELSPHPNLLQILDVVQPSSYRAFSDVYLVFPKLDSDLHSVVFSDSSLSHDQMAWIVYQITCGLAHLHASNVTHRFYLHCII